jgi:predicted KAP-like P-loop ATPase
MFKPDQPIKSSKEDILGRYSFAQSLGNAILSYKEKDSIVIGLFGAWGSGKTSIINMALEHIDNIASKTKNNNEKPIIIRFNPWNYSDQNQLITQFFKQLSVVLRRQDYADDAKKAGEQLETYAKFFEPLALVPTVGSFAIILSKVLASVGKASKSWGDLKANDLNALRLELNDLLYKQPHKIIVVIDDIDRLNNTEIRQIFQLIKSLGDFPNTIYLLPFDKSVVINALKKVQEGSGLEYLEKVVQIPFEIPLISKQEIEHLLFNQLDEVIKDIPQNKWDQTYWGNIYHSGLKYFFRNIRDVTRYVNTLRFGYALVKDEVNVIDFFAITSIQVFIPEAYYGIRDNKDIFTGVYSDHGISNIPKEIYKKRCDEIISKVDVLFQELLKDFLKRLFPKLEGIYGNINYGYDSLSDWRRDSRICSPDLFDIYFRLSLPKDEISQREIETIISLGNNPDAFTDALLKLNEDGKITRFLERLEDYTQNDIPEENIEPIITVLMDIGDLFPEGDSGFFGTDTPMRLLRLFYQLSHRFDNHITRFDIFKRAIEKATRSLYTIVHEVSVQDQQHGKYSSKETPEPEEKLTVKAAQLEELEKLACSKIESWSNNGQLEKHRYLPSILFRWKEWGQQDKVNNFVENMLKADEGLINFITSFLSKSTSHGISDYIAKIHWQINLKSVEVFVDTKEVETRIRKIFSSAYFEQLDKRKKLAIKTFLDTIDGKIKEHF